jgi:hypothetical protein
MELNRASLSFQAAKWSHSNPIQRLKQPGFNSDLFPRCLQSDWYVTWFNSSRPTLATWKKLVFEKKKKTFECEHALCNYLLPSANSESRNGWDFIYQTYKVSTGVLKWITGVFGSRKKCPVCRLPFNRRHVQACQLIDEAHFSSEDYLEQFQVYSDTKSPGLFYTPLDAAVNSLDYKLFSNLLGHISMHLI